MDNNSWIYSRDSKGTIQIYENVVKSMPKHENTLRKFIVPKFIVKEPKLP